MTQHQQPAGEHDWLSLVTRRNPLKPTYAAMRAEGVSAEAIETLWIAHEALDTPGTDPAAIADFLLLSQDTFPVTEAGVWPLGKPVWWMSPDELAAHRAAEAAAIEAGNARQSDFYAEHSRTSEARP